MSEETSLAALETQAKVVEVFSSMYDDPNMTQIAACERAGISTSTFRRWVKESPDLVDAIRAFIEASTKQSLLNITVQREAYINKLLDDALAKDTEPAQRVKIVELLEALRKEDGRQLHAEPGQEEAARDFMAQGPKRKPGSSRLTVRVEQGDKALELDLSDEFEHREIVEGEYEDIEESD
jgi:CRP-like cAMP-binding protein